MKLTVASSLLACAVNGVQIRLAIADNEPTCKCLPVPPKSTSFQTLRIWNITDPNWTAEEAMEEASKTIAVDLTRMDGFQRYTAASTGDSRLVLFMNQFDTMEQASKAEEAAIYNTTKTGNDGKLKLWLSVETEGYAAFPADTCITESSKGQWLAADVWKFLDPASVDLASLPPISEEYYNEYRKDAKGFVMFHDSANAAGDLVTWRIFDNEEDADAAEIKSANQWTGPAVELSLTLMASLDLITCARLEAYLACLLNLLRLLPLLSVQVLLEVSPFQLLHWPWCFGTHFEIFELFAVDSFIGR